MANGFISDALGGAADAVFGGLGIDDQLAAITGIPEQISETIKDAIEAAIGDIAGVLGVISEPIVNVIGDLAERIGSLVDDIASRVTLPIQVAISQFSTLATNIEGIITAAVEGALGGVIDTIGSLVTTIGESITESLAGVGNIIADVLAPLVNGVQAAVNSIAEVVDSVREGVVVGIEKAIQTIELLIRPIATVVTDIVPGLMQELAESSQVIGASLTNLPELIVGLTGTAIETSAGAISDNMIALLRSLPVPNINRVI